MEIDTPSRIAILGAGPIGIEAALYARSLGYAVDVYERGEVAGNVLRWGHVRMFSPFALNASRLGLAALAAQDPQYHPPAAEALLTGKEWVELYLRPLAASDLVVDCLHEQTAVVAIGRQSLLKSEHPGEALRADFDFRILLRDAGGERIAAAEVVIDTTGVFGNPNGAGEGGIPAIGELACRPWIEIGLPDVTGAERAKYAGKRTLVIGGGYSAATNVVALSQLVRGDPKTEVVWITRRDVEVDVHGDAQGDAGPIPIIAGDRLPERDELAKAANRLAHDRQCGVTHFGGTSLHRIDYDQSVRRFAVELSGRHEGQESFDNVVSNVGYRPDATLFEELQVQLCYASGGPLKLAAALLGENSADCLDQTSRGPRTLLNPEPNFYILGAKSYGRNSNFLVSVGLEQIRELFTIIGGRDNLNLYATVENLVP